MIHHPLPRNFPLLVTVAALLLHLGCSEPGLKVIPTSG